jgi:hypothetical protein
MSAAPGTTAKDAASGILSRTSGLAGWRKAVRKVASLEETALAEIDDVYDNVVSKGEQEEWHHEKLRLLKEESDAIADSSHAGLKSRWDVLDRFRQKKVAAAERQKNRQIESVKNMFESESLQAADECEAEKATYQAELLEMFQRRVKKLEEDLKILESEGSLDSVKPQPARKVRNRRGGPDGPAEQQAATRRRIAPFQSLMENGSSLTEDERADDFNMVQRLASQIGAS